MNDGINVLSLFDGMSCGQYSLDLTNIKVNKYYASEIFDKSIHITNKHYPNTIQLGNVKDFENWDIDYSSIDLLLFGFPCRNLSRTVINNFNHNQGLKGEQSVLFYYALKILNIIKSQNPNILFLCENVESIKQEDKDIITEYLDVKPIMIDSGLLTAQDRLRYYWTNISNSISIPEQKDWY